MTKERLKWQEGSNFRGQAFGIVESQYGVIYWMYRQGRRVGLFCCWVLIDEEGAVFHARGVEAMRDSKGKKG